MKKNTLKPIRETNWRCPTCHTSYQKYAQAAKCAGHSLPKPRLIAGDCVIIPNYYVDKDRVNNWAWIESKKTQEGKPELYRPLWLVYEHEVANMQNRHERRYVLCSGYHFHGQGVQHKYDCELQLAQPADPAAIKESIRHWVEHQDMLSCILFMTRSVTEAEAVRQVMLRWYDINKTEKAWEKYCLEKI